VTKERIYKAKTEFSLWLRSQREIDSRYGYIATDIDYIWLNMRKGLYMFIEEKRYKSWPASTQIEIFKKLDDVLTRDYRYRGFHLIQFENTNPDDGKIYLNGMEIDKEDLIKFLRFEKPLKWYSNYYFKKHRILDAKMLENIVETPIECMECGSKLLYDRSTRMLYCLKCGSKYSLEKVVE